MKREEILNMPAGREMDALIAEKVMGWKLVQNQGEGGGLYWVGHGGVFGDMHKNQTPEFSEDILDAWRVIEKMHENKYQYTLRGHFMGVEQHIATFDHQDWADANPLYSAHGATAPLAICRAALLAVNA